MLSMTYGIDINSTDDQFLNANLEASHALATVAVPGKFLVDIIPIRACLCAQNSNLRAPDGPSDSTVHPRLVPWDEVQDSCQETRDKFKIS
jgi:hypothetical protein